MKINGVEIDDTYAEAFPMRAVRLVITARSPAWAMHSARAASGLATSVIGCGCEAAIERELKPAETPDGRSGVSVLLFTMSSKEMVRQIQMRVGQCVLTSPTSACFSGLAAGDPVPMGKTLRYFGDGHQIAKVINGVRYWRLPVMDGEFLVQHSARMVKAIGGGNFLVLARNQDAALTACERAIGAMRKVADVIMPFPGGVVRSGSKVGSKYKALTASTNDAFCPTLKGQTKSQLAGDVGCVMEIVIDGLSEAAISLATRAGVRAACTVGNKGGVLRISAGNYGGKLGPHLFHLHKILK